MKSFPKKYNLKDLRLRAKSFRNINNEDNGELDVIYSLNVLSGTKKIKYDDFFFIYLRDFLNYKSLIENKRKSEQGKSKYKELFVTYGNHLEDLFSCYEFFSKRNQTLLQVGADKLERRIISTTKKCINANHRIIDNYISSDYKIYVPDLDLYVYFLENFRHLWEKGKIKKITEVGYRSFNLQTTVSPEKILRKEESKPYYVLKYFVGTKGEAIYVRVDGDIDMCCGDVALLVHPKDKRYNKYIGKKAIIPLCNRLIPIIGDENVNISQNGGIKRVCPCAEDESIELAKKYQLPTDVYVFDRKGLYTEYIHEGAFVGKERKKYYNNILEFIDDIGNLAEKGKEIGKNPYYIGTTERLVPYKIDKIVLDLSEEKQKIINQIYNHDINYSLLDDEILRFTEQFDLDGDNNILGGNFEKDGVDNASENENIDRESIIKQKINEKIGEYLPDSIVCNSQILFGWKMPLLIDLDGNLSFFDLEKEVLGWKKEPLQICFDFVLLSLIRSGTIGIKGNTNGEVKIGEYDKFYIKFFENERKIEYIIGYLTEITGKKSEYDKFMEIIENLTDENNSSLKDFLKLVDNSEFIKVEKNRVIINKSGIGSDMVDADFVELFIPCYLKNKGINLNEQIVFDSNEKKKIFKELLIQELLYGDVLTKCLLEYSYNKDEEFLGDKELTKSQIQQVQRETFSLYGENPIRLSFLVNRTFDQREILLNNLFLKQIWNAVRLCIQKDFLPNNIEECLKNDPEDFDEFEIHVLENFNLLYDEWVNIKSYEDYVKCFATFKQVIRNVFFNRYLEIVKINITKNTQFVCSYFFNFIFIFLYPFIPEFIDALQYISGRRFFHPIKSVLKDKSSNYKMNVIYNAFMKIKQLKIESNIRQHETCNIFIKSTPTICSIFAENEQIFKNYFHILDFNYLRIHESNPLGYEIYSDEVVTVGIQRGDSQDVKEKDTLESLERDIRNLEDKLDLLRQRIQLLPEGEQRTKTEEEYAKTKEEIENLTIKHSLLSSK